MTREEIKQICQIYDNLRREREAATIAYNSDDAFWEHVLVTYKLSQPSILSNLDKAAEKYANKEFPDELGCGQWGTGDYEPPVDMEYPREIAKDAFKVGAEWQREQDHDACYQCEKNYDTVFYRGEQHAIKMMREEAIERTVKEDAGGYPYINEIELYDYDKDEPTAKKGDKVGVYIFKK